jgi:hypothetical protein
VLQAIEETIAEQKRKAGQALGRPTANEYFAALVTAMEGRDQTHTPEVRHRAPSVSTGAHTGYSLPSPLNRQLVSLLEKVLSTVDAAVLRAKCKQVSAVLVQLLRTNMEHEMTGKKERRICGRGHLAPEALNRPTKLSVSCSLCEGPGAVPGQGASGAGGVVVSLELAPAAQDVLRAADLLQRKVSSARRWLVGGTVKSVPPLTHLLRRTPLPTLCRRPKVRKAAASCIVDLLKAHAARRVTALAKQVADFSANVLGACTVSDCVPTLQLLGLLQEVSPVARFGCLA